MDLINTILGTGESSRLFVELWEKRGLIYDFDSLNIAGSNYGYFRINCSTKTKFITKVREIIRGELLKIRTTPIAKNELEKSKNLILANIYRSFDSSFQLPRLLTELEMHFGRENVIVDYLERLNRIVEKTLMDVSEKYFQERCYVEAIMLPKQKLKKTGVIK